MAGTPLPSGDVSVVASCIRLGEIGYPTSHDTAPGTNRMETGRSPGQIESAGRPATAGRARLT